MTEIEAYQEYIRRRHNAFCKAVIRYAAIGKIIRLRQKWDREISLDYLTNEKFVQLAEPEPDEEYPFIVCGQTVLLSNTALADAISDFARAGAGRNTVLLLSTAAAARDRRAHWPVTQHSGAAYPACLKTAARGNGGAPV